MQYPKQCTVNTTDFINVVRIVTWNSDYALIASVFCYVHTLETIGVHLHSVWLTLGTDAASSRTSCCQHLQHEWQWWRRVARDVVDRRRLSGWTGRTFQQRRRADQVWLTHATSLICTQRRKLAASTAQPPLGTTTRQQPAWWRVTGDRTALLHQTDRRGRTAARDLFELTEDGARPQVQQSSRNAKPSNVTLLIEFRIPHRSFARRNSIFKAIIRVRNTAGTKRVSLGSLRRTANLSAKLGLHTEARRPEERLEDRSTTITSFVIIPERVFCRAMFFSMISQKVTFCNKFTISNYIAMLRNFRVLNSLMQQCFNYNYTALI